MHMVIRVKYSKILCIMYNNICLDDFQTLVPVATFIIYLYVQYK